MSAAALAMMEARYAHVQLRVAALGFARLTISIADLAEFELALAFERAAVAPLCLLIAVVCEFDLEGLSMLRVRASKAAVAHVAALPDIAMPACALEVIAAFFIVGQLGQAVRFLRACIEVAVV